MNSIWQQAFRPLFLFSSLFSSLAILIWGGFILGIIDISPYGSAYFWHAHEMIFGFVSAIIAGFLLTAVQNWTGLRATHGRSLGCLVILWLVARVLMFFGSLTPVWIVAIIDTSFLLVTALFFAQLLLQARQYKNLFIVVVLVLLSGSNFLTHLSVITKDFHYYRWGLYAAVMIITFLMVVISGRVIPMFTANGTQTKRVFEVRWLENTVLISTGLLALLYCADGGNWVAKEWFVLLFSIASIGNAIRIFRWRSWVTLKTPLVWSLHLAYWFIPTSLLLFALHHAGLYVSESVALHGLAAGAMSALILAMIARVSLGHTGRPLNPRPLMALGFILIIAAGITRVTTGLFPSNFLVVGLALAALFWAIAYFIYVALYYKILTSPRADGKVG